MTEVNLTLAVVDGLVALAIGVLTGSSGLGVQAPLPEAGRRSFRSRPGG